MLTSIVGINWGDEGKGRMVDLLSQKYDVVVRYQGGNIHRCTVTATRTCLVNSCVTAVSVSVLRSYFRENLCYNVFFCDKLQCLTTRM